MSNVIELRKKKEYHGIAHRVTFEKVPQDVLETIFYAAISVGWADGEGEYRSENPEAEAKMRELRDAVNEASRYAIPVDFKTGEPV